MVVVVEEEVVVVVVVPVCTLVDVVRAVSVPGSVVDGLSTSTRLEWGRRADLEEPTPTRREAVPLLVGGCGAGMGGDVVREWWCGGRGLVLGGRKKIWLGSRKFSGRFAGKKTSS